ncbi:hypothetical protein ID866_11846 [Astraeus odoratus]|nr:hypothetical protein ID866_11846 [Astraeus odoratus]
MVGLSDLVASCCCGFLCRIGHFTSMPQGQL